jgi:hypothetical protein
VKARWYTLIRGPLADDWYPYPFVDPTRDGGYLRVALSRLGERHRGAAARA